MRLPHELVSSAPIVWVQLTLADVQISRHVWLRGERLIEPSTVTALNSYGHRIIPPAAR